MTTELDALLDKSVKVLSFIEGPEWSVGVASTPTPQPNQDLRARRIICPHCGNKGWRKLRLIGRRVRCPHCKDTFRVQQPKHSGERGHS